MLYAIIAQDCPDSLPLRQAAQAAHSARLQQLKDEARLVLAGPFPAIDSNDPADAGFSGSLIIAEFSDLAAAQQWANTDPFAKNGVYTQVNVQPFVAKWP